MHVGQRSKRANKAKMAEEKVAIHRSSTHTTSIRGSYEQDKNGINNGVHGVRCWNEPNRSGSRL